jgi:hypothetical protein
MHMSLAGLAVLWQLSADVLPNISKVVYYVIGLLAATLFAAWLAMYALRALRHPQKVRGGLALDPSRSRALAADLQSHAAH